MESNTFINIIVMKTWVQYNCLYIQFCKMKSITRVIHHFIGILFLLSQLSIAQFGWQWQNPLPQGNHLYSVQYYNTNVGFAVGEYGTILKTTNGGKDWRLQNSGTTNTLTKVFFIDSLYGTVVGDSGTILHTKNGGKTWEAQSSGVKTFLNCVSFANRSIGFVVGEDSTVLYTSDEGITWIKRHIGYDHHIKSVWMMKNGDATIVGNPALILHTTDGGISWTKQIGDGNGYWDIAFSGSDTGMIVGYYDLILKTTNGGASWNKFSLEQLFKTYYSVSMFDGKHATIIGTGDFFTIWVTADGGDHFVRKYTDSYEAPYGVNMISEDTIVIVGERGVIYRSTNAGASWDHQYSGSTRLLHGISFFNDSEGVAVGEQSIQRTTDGGKSWIDVTLNVTGTSLENTLLVKVICLGESTTVAVGSNIILRSTDKGANWKLQETINFGAIWGLSFVDKNNGFVVGDGGWVYKTSDGGATWTLIWNTGVYTDYYRSISMLNSSVGLIAESDGKLLRTTDGGITWLKISTSVLSLETVYFFNQNNAYAIGQEGSILKSTDGGSSWTKKTSHSTDRLSGIWFTDSMNGFVVGQYGSGFMTGNMGIILRTTNGGENWDLQPSGTKNNLFDVRFIDKNKGYIVGENGSILMTSTGGLVNGVRRTNKNEYNLSDFNLDQNFPNPFNPSTTINYSLPERCTVRISIFNTLGQKISEIVNETNDAGSYERSFTASNVSSGIYFYRIEAASTQNSGRTFVETKKMVVMK